VKNIDREIKMQYTEADIQKMTDHAHELLNQLSLLTATYLSKLNSPHTSLVAQGALGIYMKNILKATLHSMGEDRKEKMEFIGRFRKMIINTIYDVEISEFSH